MIISLKTSKKQYWGRQCQNVGDGDVITLA